MSQFYITSENTEDTFDSADSLPDAIRIARELAKRGKPATRFALKRMARILGFLSLRRVER